MKHSRSFRNRKQAILLALLWGAGFGLYIVLEASPIIVALLFLVSLPAAYDFLRGDTATLEITSEHVKWSWRKHDHTVDLSNIAHVQLTTRLDLSLRMTLHLTSGRKLRVIDPCVIGTAHDLEMTFANFGIRVKRSHFSLL